jgi:ATP-binding cassette subfamily F protein 3
LRKFTGGVLVVSHDRYFLDQVATRVAELGNGTIVERSGNYTTFMEQKERMRAFAQKEQFRLKEEIKKETAIADQLKSAQKISAWKSRLKKVEKLQQELDVTLKETQQHHHLYRTVAPKLSLGQIKHVSAEIAMAENLSKTFGQVELFSQVSFLITGGEKVGIIGPNGCGKTTLLNILLGKDKDYSGKARLGEWVRYGYLGQEITFEDEERTLMEELLSVREMSEDEAKRYLARYQFYGDEVDKRIKVLSGGEKVRLYLACMMLKGPDCLIMDEPTNHLDIPARDALESALLEFKGTLIAISHDRFFLNRCINRILEFSKGSLVSYQGNYERYREIKAQAERPEAVNAQAKNAVNKVRDRAETRKAQEALRKQAEIMRTEARIAELEALKKSMEESFGVDTPPETYVEYDGILKALDELYQLYVELEA